MREELLAEIANLEERETYFMNQIRLVEQTTPMNMTQYNAFKDELTNVQNKLAGKREELAKIEGAAVTAQAELANQFENLTVGDSTLTLRELCADEKSYQFISIYLQGYVGDMAQSHAAIVSSYKSEKEALEEKVADLEGQVDELEAFRKQALNLADKLEDMEQRRDAAAEEIDAAKEENKRLAADNESLRKQLEKTTNNSGPTNLTSNLADLAKQIRAQKPGIYNKRWGKNANGLEVKTHYIANLSATGEEIEIPYLEVGKYREETAAEAETFRAEEAARHAAENALQNSPLVVPTLLPSQGAGSELAEGEPSEDGAVVTREEFTALAARVVQLEQSQRSVA